MREMWGVYSVTDHLVDKAFVADLMLYDRLVIPIPSDDDHERWARNGWDEARQSHILSILGKRAVPVVWGADWQAKWKSRWEAAKSLGACTNAAAMRMTPTVLLEMVPRTATGVIAVAAFDSPDTLSAGMKLQQNPVTKDTTQPAPPGVLAAVIGREFLVPNNPERNDDDLLREALSLSADAKFRRKRAAYWRWQQEFLRDATVLDKKAIDEAVEEMNEMIHEENAAIDWSHIKHGVSFAFAVGAAGLGMLVGPLAPIAVASAFLSIGGWIIDHSSEFLSGDQPATSSAAMCLSARRAFGWIV